jgi:molybdopterin-guanine dinucleotide biosynthesis protein A
LAGAVGVATSGHIFPDPMASSVALLSGVVLAGGLSTRMGRDKSLMELDGVPLWRRQYNLLAQAGAADRMLSVRADQKWPPLDVTRVVDAAPDLGPLAGIAAALAKTRHSHLLVLAVDMPRVPLAWFARIRERCAERIGVVGVRADGNFEPLAAIYPQAMLPLVRAAISDRELSLQKLIARGVDEGFLRVQEIPAAEAVWFENWNEPADVSGQP